MRYDVYKGRTMAQYYKTTKPTFTTNWYLYKTQAYQLRVKREENNKIINNYSIQKWKENNSLENITINITDNFEDIFLEAIDDGLSILGETAKNTVYSYLKRTFKMTKQEIPHRIDEYVTAIENMFGIGAKLIQIQTMKSLYKKVRCQIKQYPNHKNLTFTEYFLTLKLEKEQQETRNKQPLIKGFD